MFSAGVKFPFQFLTIIERDTSLRSSIVMGLPFVLFVAGNTYRERERERERERMREKERERE